jgi:S-DNA-T family DNA segregation ATPase FtsK/SpoIIIE
MSLFDEVAIGRDEHGQQVGLELFGHNLLAGGEPGSAKSNLLHLVAAATALDPQASLWILDPKVVEFRLRYQGVAAAVAGDDIAEANAVLERLSEEMAARYRLLEARGKRKVSPGDGLHVLVVDEVMLYLHDPDKRAAARFATLLRSLVALGRAAGIIVAIATQKPSAEVIPSAIRDLVTYRAAFRCTTKEASDTILGSGWAAQGASASEIDAGQPGVCYLLAEGARPVKVRCYHLEDDAIDVMVSAARRWGR